MHNLNLTEEMILVAIMHLKENAYGVTIRKHLSKVTKKIFPYGTLYSALDGMVRKDYLIKTVGDPSPERGGRRKNYYKLTEKGIEVLKYAFEMKNALWDDKIKHSIKYI